MEMESVVTYGNGSYSFSVAGEVVASGATFTNSDVSTFCVEPTNVDGCTDFSMQLQPFCHHR